MRDQRRRHPFGPFVEVALLSSVAAVALAHALAPASSRTAVLSTRRFSTPDAQTWPGGPTAEREAPSETASLGRHGTNLGEWRSPSSTVSSAPRAMSAITTSG